jgi:hypothetical protein
MAMTKLLFCDSNIESSVTLEVFANNNNELTFLVEQTQERPAVLTLDKQTAIKLVKTLKTEISKIGGEDD